jgi:hypothetical protein
MIEAMSMNVESRGGITPQDATRSPVAVPSRGQGVLIADFPDFDVLDQPDTVLGQPVRAVDDIIGRCQQRSDRAGMATVEANSAQRPHLSHRGNLFLVAESRQWIEQHALVEQRKTPHPSMRGVSDLQRPDMIIDVTMLGPAWHAQPDPGEPGRVYRRSYSDGHLASGRVAYATDPSGRPVAA